jgi:hypothetical protein
MARNSALNRMDLVRESIRIHGRIKAVRKIGPAEIAVAHTDGYEYAVGIPHEFRGSGKIVSAELIDAADQAIHVTFENGDQHTQYFRGPDGRWRDEEAREPGPQPAATHA